MTDLLAAKTREAELRTAGLRPINPTDWLRRSVLLDRHVEGPLVHSGRYVQQVWWVPVAAARIVSCGMTALARRELLRLWADGQEERVERVLSYAVRHGACTSTEEQRILRLEGIP